jgi:hypothetical protein
MKRATFGLDVSFVEADDSEDLHHLRIDVVLMKC